MRGWFHGSSRPWVMTDRRGWFGLVWFSRACCGMVFLVAGGGPAEFGRCGNVAHWQARLWWTVRLFDCCDPHGGGVPGIVGGSQPFLCGLLSVGGVGWVMVSL